ncbi:MAG: zinc-binding alcohol dehydrogenase [Myxococcales bacterium]|nr:zinc-binding alcohol dehydrogenase [Myxococcales bacterium]
MPEPGLARAFWTVGRERGELRSEALAPVGPDQLLVQALYSAISRGSETLVLRGEVPTEEHARMRAPHQTGEFPWPVKYGYSNVGRVIEGPSEWKNRVVFCLYPHQDRYVVHADDVVPVPAGTPIARAVLAANMETAINAVWDAGLCAGDRVVVIGAGVVGLLVAYLAARHPECEVCVVDVDARKATAANRLGLPFAAPCDAAGEADRVFHASGQAGGLQTALQLAGDEATVVELSWYGKRHVEVPLGGAFHSRRLRLISSQVGRLPAERRTRWTPRRRLALALQLLAEDRLDALFGAEVPFEGLPRVMKTLVRPDDSTLCQRVKYAGAE